MNWPTSYLRLPNLDQKLGPFFFTSIRYSDREAIRIWRNRQTSVLRQDQPISKQAQDEYFKSVLLPDFFSIEPKQIFIGMHSHKKLIAYGGLVHIDWSKKRAEVSFLTSGNLTPLKYELILVKFLKFLKTIAKNDLDFDKLVTETFAFRTQHIRILEKNGFMMEGSLESRCKKNGTLIASILHGSTLV